MMKQLKSRYGDKGKFTKFILGIDKAKMTLYEVDKDLQKEGRSDPELMRAEEAVDKQFEVPFEIKSTKKVSGSGFKFI